MKQQNVLISPVNGRNAGTEAYHALALARLAKRIVVTDIIPFSYGAHLGERFVIQPMASSPRYLRFLLRLIRRERIGVVIPGSDPELRVMVRHREELARAGAVALVNNEAVVNCCLDKDACARRVRELGFSAPRTVALTAGWLNPGDFTRLRRAVGCPLVLKPRSVSGGSGGVRVIQDAADWREFCSGGTADYVAQEYIDAAAAEFTIGVISDAGGRVVSSFALRRDLTNSASLYARVPRKRGPGGPLVVSSGLSQGMADDFPRARRAAERLATALGSTGPLNIQARWHRGRLCVFEINPRFSGTTSVRAVLGHNDVALAWAALVDGRNPGQARYRAASVVRGKSILTVPLRGR